MDFNIAAGYVSLAIVILREIVVFVNHKRCRSRCCNYQMTTSLDVDNTTPDISSVRLGHLPATVPSSQA